MEKTPEEQAVIDAAKQLLHYWERISFHAPANAIEHEFVKAVRAVRDLEAAAAGST